MNSKVALEKLNKLKLTKSFIKQREAVDSGDSSLKNLHNE